MEKREDIINRVANSSLMTLNLEDYIDKRDRVIYDLKENLYQELILKEKDFRAFLKENDWGRYSDKNVGLICSADAIVPTWAYMLLASKIQPYANMVVFGDLNELERVLIKDALATIDFAAYENAKVVIKGCSNLPAPEFAFVEATRLLRPYASSIMFGEPCSTVPIYKKPRVKK